MIWVSSEKDGQRVRITDVPHRGSVLITADEANTAAVHVGEERAPGDPRPPDVEAVLEPGESVLVKPAEP